MAGKRNGKVAIVTGAGQGIGRGIALALAADGFTIGAVGRTKGTLDDTVTTITDRGGHAVAVVADVKDNAQVEAAVEQVVSSAGPPAALVNGAHEFAFGPLCDTDPDDLQAGWQSGPLGALRMMRACHHHLAGGGSIVNIGSSAALAPPAGVGGYAAVKSALHALSRAAANEWAPDGIRVNLVLPVALTPPMEAAFAANPGMQEHMTATIPLGRIGDPETDIGRAVAFLCSADARYITGATLTVDGGEAHLR